MLRLHGHPFKIEWQSSAGDPELGWVMDFGDLAREAGGSFRALICKVLNDIEDLRTDFQNISGTFTT